MASAGAVSINASWWTLVYDPDADGYATSVSMWTETKCYVRVDNLQGGEWSEGLHMDTDSDYLPTCFSFAPRGLGKIYAKSTKDPGDLHIAITSRLIT